MEASSDESLIARHTSRSHETGGQISFRGTGGTSLNNPLLEGDTLLSPPNQRPTSLNPTNIGLCSRKILLSFAFTLAILFAILATYLIIHTPAHNDDSVEKPLYLMYNATLYTMDPDHQQQYFTYLEDTNAFATSSSSSSSSPPSSPSSSSSSPPATPATPLTAFVVSSHGRFMRIGTDGLRNDPAYTNIPHINMDTRTILPGLTDAHAHLLALGLAHTEVDVSTVTSKKKVLEVLSEFISEKGLDGNVDPGYFIMGGRWDQNIWEDSPGITHVPELRGNPDGMDGSISSNSDSDHGNTHNSYISGKAQLSGKPFPTASDLDVLFPNIPIALYRVDMHAIWANSAAMRVIAPIPSENPPGGEILRNPDGSPTGIFLDNAMQLFTLHPYAQTPKHVRVQAAEVAMRECIENGLTSVHDAMLLDTDFDLLQELLTKKRNSWENGGIRDFMPLRVYGMLDAEMVCGPRNFTCPERFPVRDIDSHNAVINTNSRKTSNGVNSGNPPFFPDSHPSNGVKSSQPLHPWLRLPLVRNGKQGRLSMSSVKLVLDGALGSWGANMIEPYSDRQDTTGIQMYTRDRLLEIVKKMAEQGYQVNTHAIGDKAVQDLIWALKTTISDEEEKGGTGRLRRHRIEHLQIASENDIGDLRGWGIIPSMQPTHAISDMVYAESRVGKNRLKHAYSWSEAWKAAGIVALGTDFPIEDVNPRSTLHAAVTMQNSGGFPSGGWLPDHVLSRYMAIRGMTWDGAYAALQEHNKGSIREGKVADFVVFDRDLMTCEPADILTARVLGTFVDGNAVFIHADELAQQNTRQTSKGSGFDDLQRHNSHNRHNNDQSRRVLDANVHANVRGQRNQNNEDGHGGRVGHWYASMPWTPRAHTATTATTTTTTTTTSPTTTATATTTASSTSTPTSTSTSTSLPSFLSRSVQHLQSQITRKVGKDRRKRKSTRLGKSHDREISENEILEKSGDSLPHGLSLDSNNVDDSASLYSSSTLPSPSLSSSTSLSALYPPSTISPHTRRAQTSVLRHKHIHRHNTMTTDTTAKMTTITTDTSSHTSSQLLNNKESHTFPEAGAGVMVNGVWRATHAYSNGFQARMSPCSADLPVQELLYRAGYRHAGGDV